MVDMAHATPVRLLDSRPMAPVRAVTAPLAFACTPTSSITLFLRTVNAPAMVCTWAASTRSFSNASGSTVAMIFDVICPSSAIFFSAPTGIPMPSASAFINRGAASFTALNSSPRSVPDANAWDSCSCADADSEAAAPDTLSARFTTSVIAATCFCDVPSSRVPLAIRAYSTPVSASPCCDVVAIRLTSAYARAYSRVDVDARRSWAVNLAYASDS